MIVLHALEFDNLLLRVLRIQEESIVFLFEQRDLFLHVRELASVSFLDCSLLRVVEELLFARVEFRIRSEERSLERAALEFTSF